MRHLMMNIHMTRRVCRWLMGLLYKPTSKNEGLKYPPFWEPLDHSEESLLLFLWRLLYTNFACFELHKCVCLLILREWPSFSIEPTVKPPRSVEAKSSASLGIFSDGFFFLEVQMPAIIFEAEAPCSCHGRNSHPDFALLDGYVVIWQNWIRQMPDLQSNLYSLPWYKDSWKWLPADYLGHSSN